MKKIKKEKNKKIILKKIKFQKKINFKKNKKNKKIKRIKK